MSLGLLGAYDSSSSSDSESDTQHSKQESPTPLSNPFKDSSSGSLPKPSFRIETEDFRKSNVSLVSDNLSESSVFKNVFKEKEAKKQAVLEQHVSMTVKTEDKVTIEGKKVCWNFRKGRCRFGHKCTFAHDSDINLRKPEHIPRVPDINVPTTSTLIKITNSLTQQNSDLSEDSQGFKKKKRPGLSQGITPSKKAMKFHNQVYNNSSK